MPIYECSQHLISENCVVEIGRACSGESDLHLLGQASVVLVPRPHVKVVAAPRHDRFQETGDLVVVELHFSFSGRHLAKSGAGIVVAVGHLDMKNKHF